MQCSRFYNPRLVFLLENTVQRRKYEPRHRTRNSTKGKQRCEYCRLPEQFSRLNFSLDHVLAKQHGGTDELDNLALACGYCNRHKGPNIAGIDPETKQMSRLFNPRVDVWIEHFRWQGVSLQGITPIGRATIVVLGINRRTPMSIRRVLMDEGVFELPS